MWCRMMPPHANLSNAAVVGSIDSCEQLVHKDQKIFRSRTRRIAECITGFRPQSVHTACNVGGIAHTRGRASETSPRCRPEFCDLQNRERLKESGIHH